MIPESSAAIFHCKAWCLLTNTLIQRMPRQGAVWSTWLYPSTAETGEHLLQGSSRCGREAEGGPSFQCRVERAPTERNGLCHGAGGRSACKNAAWLRNYFSVPRIPRKR
jgi:hypothetical protein